MNAEELAHLRVNSLEKPYESTALHVPDKWTPEHLALRIEEAFYALDRSVHVRGPKTFGSNWPSYQPSSDDLSGWTDATGVSKNVQALGDPAKDNAEARLKGRAPMSVIELTRMDIILGWLSGLRVKSVEWTVVLQAWGYARAIGVRSMDKVAAAHGFSKATFYRRREDALKALSSDLNARGRGVF